MQYYVLQNLKIKNILLHNSYITAQFLLFILTYINTIN